MKIVAETLCELNLDLCSVALVFCFLFNELESNESQFAAKMVAALKYRLAAGTNTKLLSGALYLKHEKHFGAKMKNIGVKLKSKTQEVMNPQRPYRTYIANQKKLPNLLQRYPIDLTE